MSRGPRDGLPFWNQLGPLPVEQWCSNAEHERNEVDSFGESLNFIAEVVYSVKISDLRPPATFTFSRAAREESEAGLISTSNGTPGATPHERPED
jgi:hypothetical protein